MRGRSRFLSWAALPLTIGVVLALGTPSWGCRLGCPGYPAYGSFVIRHIDGLNTKLQVKLENPAAKKGLTTGTLVLNGVGSCVFSPVGPPESAKTAQTAAMTLADLGQILWSNGQLSAVSAKSAWTLTYWKVATIAARFTGVGHITGVVRTGPFAGQKINAYFLATGRPR